MHLTDSQKAAVRAFEEFLQGNCQVFMLKGSAGTGKTTLVREFLSLLDGRQRPVCLMAPTGRAAHILGSKTNHAASTVHREIYGLSGQRATGQNKENEEDVALQLRFKLRDNTESPNTVYIVDEASMVSDSFSENEAFSFGSGCLLSDLFEYVHGRKVVFVGDYAQLPPVGMNFSPALDGEYMQEKFSCKIAEVMLTEVMRQGGESVMLSNALRVRDSIDRKIFNEFRLSSGHDSVAEKFDILAPYFELFPTAPSVRSIVVAHSNKQVLEYNLSIRRHYYGEEAPRLQPGELLMICRNNYAFEEELFNGSIVKVKACQSDHEFVQHSVRVKVGKDRVEPVTLRFRNATICFSSFGKPVELRVMLLDNFLDDSSGALGSLLTRALIVDFNNRLPDGLRAKMSAVRSQLKAGKKLSVEQQEAKEAYERLLYKDPYYNAVICKYGYATTCHKAQGGEWENVFVDMSRFVGTANEDYYRWAYTALTRASKRIWHFRAPDFGYISGLEVMEIQLASKIKVSNYSDGADFRLARFQRIRKLAAKAGLTASDDLSKPYQHLITLGDEQGNKATFQLWYKAKGYNGTMSTMSSTSEELTALGCTLIDNSYAPDEIPFRAPERPFAEKLVSFVRSQLDDLGIQLLDITSEAYQDVFHLKTDGLAQMSLNYNRRGVYTYMRLISSLGPNDEKLQALRRRFM